MTDAASAPKEVTNARVLKIAVPIVLANITVPLLGLVDTGVVGQLGEAAPMKGGSTGTRSPRARFLLHAATRAASFTPWMDGKGALPEAGCDMAAEKASSWLFFMPS